MSRCVGSRAGRLHVVVVTGNIGAGKSTLLRDLSERLPGLTPGARVVTLEEDVSGWSTNLRRFYDVLSAHADGTFEALCAECPSWRMAAYTFQLQILGSYAALTGRLHQLSEEAKHANVDCIALVERSPEDVAHVFLGANRHLYTDQQFDALMAAATALCACPPWSTSHVIFLSCELEECERRVNKRKRPEETTMDSGYLQVVHQYYSDMMARREVAPRVRRINAASEPHEVAEVAAWNVKLACDL